MRLEAFCKWARVDLPCRSVLPWAANAGTAVPPTPRWTAHDAKFFGVEMPEGTTMQLQDRAYT